MAGLAKLLLWSGGGLVHVVVETPRGSRVKVAYDELECFAMSRALMVGPCQILKLSCVPG
jgi:hypothetical protein